MIFYFDENLPPQIAKALNILDRNNDIYSVKEHFAGLSDIELIPKLAEKKAILITFDKNMRRYKAEREALNNNEMIVFFFSIKLDYWRYVKLSIKIWDKILSTAKNATKPSFYRITGKGKIENL